jgi:anaerobic dimethyl sulfoxide reductase subunit A
MSDQSFISNVLKDTVMTRRSFLKWSAALGGTAALAGGVTVGMKAVAEAAGQEADVQVVSTSCYHNCGGRCILNAEIKEGTIQRLLPDMDLTDTFENPRAIPCVRGRAQTYRVYSEERLKYPMKRVGKRGEGKFEQISWEEALDTIADKLKYTIEKYGNESMYYQYASGQIGGGIDMTYKGTGPISRLFHMLGGYVNFYGTYSSACYGAALPYITAGGSNSQDDMINSKLVVLFADNPMVTRAGGKGAGYFCLKAKEAGTKFIVVDPRLTDSAVALEAEWIPIYPGTDVALIAALAHVMIVEGLYDSDFCARYTVGFDEGNLPEGAPPNSSWMAYVTGQADGQPKTPRWASQITGIPEERIISLAREIATTKPCCLLQGLGWQRRAYGEQPVRALPILAAMTGNFGIAGGSAGTRQSGGATLRMGSFPAGENPVKATISVFMWPDFIERGDEMTNGPRDRIRGVEKLNSKMKFMWNWAGNCITNQHSDINLTTKMLEDDTKLEFIVVSDVVMTHSAKFADILLPDCTSFEVDNLLTGGGEGTANFAVFSHKLIEPLYESRDVLWVAEQLADRMGLGEEFREGHNSREDWLRDMVDVARENDENFPTYEEFKKMGVYKVFGQGKRVAFTAFREDPVANPLKTPTGKIEIYSPFLADLEDPEEIPAIPKYIPEWEGVSDPLREKYPLLMVGHHAPQRSHSTFDNVKVLEEVHPQSFWINTLDAKERDIKNGDKVKVYNDRGVVHMPAFVTNRIRPGVTSMPQGAWFTPDANGVDTRGCVNTLTKYHPTPFAKGNPQHTNLVQVEKL